jgi:hypothetical protein
MVSYGRLWKVMVTSRVLPSAALRGEEIKIRRFLDVFSGMIAPLEGLEEQGFGTVGPETQAFNDVGWRMQPFSDPMDPLKTSRKRLGL